MSLAAVLRGMLFSSLLGISGFFAAGGTGNEFMLCDNPTCLTRGLIGFFLGAFVGALCGIGSYHQFAGKEIVKYLPILIGSILGTLSLIGIFLLLSTIALPDAVRGVIYILLMFLPVLGAELLHVLVVNRDPDRYRL